MTLNRIWVPTFAAPVKEQAGTMKRESFRVLFFLKKTKGYKDTGSHAQRGVGTAADGQNSHGQEILPEADAADRPGSRFIPRLKKRTQKQDHNTSWLVDLKTRIAILAYLKSLRAPSQTHFFEQTRILYIFEITWDLFLTAITENI